jgi:hypothetical protein
VPTGVFPYIGSWGSTKEVRLARTTHVYDDGTYRTYRRSGTVVQQLDLKISAVSKSDRDAIDSFFQARMASTTQAGFEFYLYDPDDVSAVDPTGASSTGRHAAIFVTESLRWTRDGGCRWSTSVPILLVS